MYLPPYTILIVLLVTMILFIWGRWRYDIVAFIALSISVAIGAIPFSKAYTGLSNSAVITVACVMIISSTISRSGVLNYIIRKLSYFTKHPSAHVGSLSIITAILSAFMNNVGALGLMMPIGIKTSIDNKRSPSLILMPIALASSTRRIMYRHWNTS